MEPTINRRLFNSLFYEPFLGWLYLYGQTESCDLIELNKYLDTPENRAALRSQLDATETKLADWHIA